MGATYTRQSSSGIVDGGVIEASDLNNEFDQLLAAFVAASGHTHDGTTAEGGPVTKLLGTSLTLGDGTSGTDITVTFDGESADGVLTWMEDEDYFKFSDEVLMNSTEKLLFGDTGTYIHQSADGVLDLVSDSEIEINATTIDINGAVDISGNTTVGGDLTVTGDDITMGTNTSGMLLVADGTNFNPVAVSGDVTMASNGAITIASTAVENSMLAGSIADSKLSTISTADKVAGGAIQIDSGTDGTSITLADTDKFLVDDGGTTKYINASQLNTYTSAAVALDDISTGDAAVTLATSSGNITIDAQAGDADIIFKGTDSSSDITALTLDMSEAGAATFNNKVVATELDISGDVDIDGTLEADAVTINGTAIGSIYGVVAGSSSIVTTGALDSGSITSGFGAIDNGTSNIRSATITAETAFVPDASGGADLGTATLEFNDAFFNDSAVINFGDDQDITLTHVADTGLTLAGAHANGTNLQLNNTATDGDSAIQFALSGTVAYTMGVEDGDSDKFVINYGTGALGAQPALEISSAGAVTVPGDLTVSGTLTGAASAGFALAMAVAL